MNRTLSALAFSAGIAASASAAEPGLVKLKIEAPHHGRSMDMGIMFPAEGGSLISLGENPVFYGAPVHQNATPAPGKYPVILLSHGWGGNFMRMGWLEAGLASRGAIVVAVNHPNSTTGDLNVESALHHWTRAQDMSTALDYVLKDPAFAPHVDASRIYAAGYSYGGWTALSLAGLKGNPDGYAQYCKAAGSGSVHCRDLTSKGFKISAEVAALWRGSYKDARVTAAVALDPGLTWGLSKSDTETVDVPVMLIGLGEGKDRLAAADTTAQGSNLEALLPEARVEHLAPAWHFTALGLCKPKGEALLKEANDDPVCTDPPGTDRKAVLDGIIGLMARHFKLD